jgi:hypothetical protein
MVIEVSSPIFIINLEKPTEVLYNNFPKFEDVKNYKIIISQIYHNGLPEPEDDEILYKYKETIGYIFKHNK